MVLYSLFSQNRHNRNDGGERFGFSSEWNRESNQTDQTIRVVVVPQRSQPRPQPKPSIATVSDDQVGPPTYEDLFPDVSRNHDGHI